MIIAKADGHLKESKDGSLKIVKEANQFPENHMLNERIANVYHIDELLAIKTDGDEEFVLPKSIKGDFINGAHIVDTPDEMWNIEYWRGMTLSKSRDFMGDDYVVERQFPYRENDRTIVRIAKEVVNEEQPFIFNAEDKSNKRWVNERMKEIERNTLSEKQFFRLMDQLDKEMEIVVTDKGDKRISRIIDRL